MFRIKRTDRILLSLALFLSALASGCAQDAGSGSNAETPPMEEEQAFSPREDSEYPSDLVELAISELEGRISEEAIEVDEIEPVMWFDSSLGGVTSGALDVETPGFRIVLISGDSAFLYHTDMEQVVFVRQHEASGGLGPSGEPVEGGEPVLSYPREDETYPTQLVELAISDLASFSGVDKEQIEVGEIEPVTWSDASLGLESGGVLQVLTPGFRIFLISDEKTFLYHTDLERVVRVGQVE